MPITNVQFDDGIFFCKEEGNISQEDALHWVELVTNYVKQRDGAPVVAVVDAFAVKTVSLEAREILAQSTKTTGIVAGAIATDKFTTIQTARVIGLISPEPHTYVFRTLKEATEFARETLDNNGNLAKL